MSEEQVNTIVDDAVAAVEPQIEALVETVTQQVVDDILEVSVVQNPVVDSSAGPRIYYNGQYVVEQRAETNGDGRLCLLSDGSTAYVPLSILGEK